MHYRPTDGTIDIATAEEFLALCNEETVVAPKENYIEIERRDLREDGTQIVYLQRGKAK